MRDKTEIPFGRPWITDEDRDAVHRVLSGHILTHGPEGRAFEEAFAAAIGGGSCTSTSSCMAALHLACLHFRFGAGDEVLVPAQTHVATAHAVELVGAKPVFVDCELVTGNMNLAEAARAITPHTRGIMVVHYAGIPVAMPDVMRLAERHDLAVVEDCALAVGARFDGRHVGLFGHAGCYSFYPVKHITTGEGGMFVSRDADVVAAVARFRAFGVDRTHAERTIPGVYDVTGAGMNYRMSEMQAALGRSQLERLPEILARRRENFGALAERLAGTGLVTVLDAADDRARSSHYCLTALLQRPLAVRRDELVARLNADGVGTSVYYPHPVPRLGYYRFKYGYDSALYRGAEAISDHSLALPVGPHLDSSDINRIGDTFERAAADLAVTV